MLKAEEVGVCREWRVVASDGYAARPERRLFAALAGSKTTRILIPVALAKRSNADRLGLAEPLSSRAIVDCDVPILLASSTWDSCPLGIIDAHGIGVSMALVARFPRDASLTIIQVR